VTFEVYEDMPGVQCDGEIASLPGLGRAAWFRDSEGNIMCIDEGMPGT
jgi:predicted enzyme related to lactoylglutathione lyase